MVERFKAIARSGWVWPIGLGILVGFIVFLHLWQIADIPRGLYVDESSIGLNAADIAKSLYDEHGHFLPVYFEAFGEYKNPVYIYTAAILFKFLGVSVWTLRFTSVLYWGVFMAGLLVLVRTLFPGNRWALTYALLAGGFLPWLFTLSRISFEVISQPAVWIWVLWAIYQGYQNESTRLKQWWCLAAGLLAGLSVYTYSTGRLLTFGLMLTVLIVYWKRPYWLRHAWFGVGALVAFLPYIYFSLAHQGALTARFGLLSYVFDPKLSLWQKVLDFWSYYWSYFSLDFLLWHGDANLRHHTGASGEVYFAVLALALVGFGWLMARRPSGLRQYGWLILLNMIGAPMAAALTEPGHSLRSLLIGIYLLVFSIFGFMAVQNMPSNYWRRIITFITFLLIVLEANTYVTDYFISYPQRSVQAFESYNFPKALSEAIDQHPSQVIVSDQANQPYAHLDFYRLTVTNPENIPLLIGSPTAQPDTCIIYFSSDETIYGADAHRQTFSDDTGYSHVTCFDN